MGTCGNLSQMGIRKMRKLTKQELRNMKKQVEQIDKVIYKLSTQMFDLMEAKKGLESFLDSGIALSLTNLKKNVNKKKNS